MRVRLRSYPETVVRFNLVEVRRDGAGKLKYEKSICFSIDANLEESLELISTPLARKGGISREEFLRRIGEKLKQKRAQECSQTS